MECERLIKLVKTWYLQVKDEALAPARMVAFMQKHVAECPVCLVDDGVQQEVDRITRIVLPPSKVPKVKQDSEDEEPALSVPALSLVRYISCASHTLSEDRK